VLHITSERVFQLAPLEIPATDRLLSAAALGKIASVRLFQERSGLSLTTDNAQKVMQLCRELEGIPLAIELAAARTSSLSVGQILDSMQERLKLLTRGNGSVEERRWATLRQAIQFSYDMLTAPQKQLLIRLSVFRRGCTWEAASAVCRSDGQDRYAIADLLDDLRARSLLVVEGGDSEKRYRLLDSIREFATQELPATESQTIAVRHVAWFVSLAERGGAELLGKDQALWLDRLAGDADNFRGAIQESVRTRQGETAMRLVAALWRLTEIRGFLREGREWLKMVLDMPETRAQPALRSKVLSGAGMLAYRQGDMPTAEQYFTQSYKLEQALNDKHGMATALNDLGNVAQMAIEFAKAQSYYEQGRTLEEETHNARGVAVALFNLGTCARRLGDLDKAEDLLKQSRKKFEEAGNRRDAAFPINGLALVAMARGKLEDSITLARESLKIRNELSDKKGVADAQRTLGAIALQQGKLASALELLTESLDMARGLDDRRGMAETLELFAAASAGEKEFTTSEPLYAAAKRIREEIHVYLAPIESERRETDHAKARIALGPTEVDRLQAEGMGRRITEDIRVAHGFREKNVGETGG
jgi:predicted ATPase/Tfp pilus assembly protein PilF